MKKGLLVLIFNLIVLPVVFAAGAYQITYIPEDKPLYSLKLTDGWSVNFQNDRITAILTDGLVWFGTWKVPEISTFEAAVEKLDRRLEELFTDIEIERADEAEINGMPGRIYQGNAKQEGEDVVFLVIFFEPTDQTIAVAAFLGDPIAKEIHVSTVTEVIGSIQPQG